MVAVFSSFSAALSLKHSSSDTTSPHLGHLIVVSTLKEIWRDQVVVMYIAIHISMLTCFWIPGSSLRTACHHKNTGQDSWRDKLRNWHISGQTYRARKLLVFWYLLTIVLLFSFFYSCGCTIKRGRRPRNYACGHVLITLRPHCGLRYSSRWFQNILHM